MKKFACILGGTGFSVKSPRIRTAIEFLKNNTDFYVITSGLGVEAPYEGFEREYVASLLLEVGIHPWRIIVGSGGDRDHRNTRDDILQIINAIPWRHRMEPELLFFTEGWLHAFRVRAYCRAQIPLGRPVKITTLNCDTISRERRLREIKSFAKCLWWLLRR